MNIRILEKMCFDVRLALEEIQIYKKVTYAKVLVEQDIFRPIVHENCFIEIKERWKVNDRITVKHLIEHRAYIEEKLDVKQFLFLYNVTFCYVHYEIIYLLHTNYITHAIDSANSGQLDDEVSYLEIGSDIIKGDDKFSKLLLNHTYKPMHTWFIYWMSLNTSYHPTEMYLSVAYQKQLN